MLIDTHTHLYLDQFNNDIEQVVQRAIQQDVRIMLLPNIDTQSVENVFALYDKFEDIFRPMVGLHPCSVTKEYEGDLTELGRYLKTEGVVAVGEIGIDLHWDVTYRLEQIHAFEKQIDWALEMDLPIVIHSRKAIQECIDIVKSKQNGSLRGVFHCFDQDRNAADQIVELGFYIGIGGVITFKNNALFQVAKDIDLQHIILETDSPYLAPTPYRGKRNESSYVRLVADKLAEAKGVSVKEVEHATTNNAIQLFRL